MEDNERWKWDAEEFLRLAKGMSDRVAKVGDRVIVAAGFLGRGWRWIREEAEIVDIGETSYKIRFAEASYDDSVKEEWIHPALITDVLPAKQPEREPQAHANTPTS